MKNKTKQSVYEFRFAYLIFLGAIYFHNWVLAILGVLVYISAEITRHHERQSED